jgi:protein arginine N-methyltransferase 1
MIALSQTTMTSDDLKFHAFCLTETGTRLDQYARAIAARVRPGDVVLDLGAGTGILSFLATAAGARLVYAMEASDVIACAELLASRSGVRDRLRFIHASSSEATLDEQVDVIVADIHDTFGLQPTGLRSLIDARDRFLKPGGCLIPARTQLVVAPVDVPHLYQRTVDVWRTQVHGVDLSPLRTFATNRPHPARFEPSEALGPPAIIASIDFMSVNHFHAGGSAQVTTTRSGMLHGVCGCFVTMLADGVTISNVPGRSETTHFAQVFFPLETPCEIAAGDVIDIQIDTFDGSESRWQIGIAHRDGRSPMRFDHSTFHGTPLTLKALKKQTPDYRPRLTVRGTMERALLDRFDGTCTAAELETWLTDRFGSALPSALEATALVKATIDRCG